MTRVEINRAAWIEGFMDGEPERPQHSRPGVDGYSYASGWIEGQAKLQGYEYSLGEMTELILRDGP